MEWLVALIVLLVVVALLRGLQRGRLSDQLARQYLEQGARIIDVRSPEEYQSGHVPGAVNLPLGVLRERITAEVPDKAQVLLLHCLSGGRSALGQRHLKQMGYARVFNLGSYRRAERLVQESATRARRESP